VMYLQAADDTLVPSSAARLALKDCPAMKVVPLRGPHCLLQTVPTEAAALVATFVRETESAA